ncbi:MAG: tetratricopeptide repeat protein [Methanophagales archaeon]|nr:tetratricopeptide repeat protein [Methanophagales archaeon]
MKSKDVATIVWKNPILFFDEVIKADAEVLLIIDGDVNSSKRNLNPREDIVSFFRKDTNLFLIRGEEPSLFLVRREILLMFFPHVVRVGGGIESPGDFLKLEKKKRIEKLVPHVLKLGETISSFKDLLKFIQADPFCRGLLRGYNVEGPYPFWAENNYCREDTMECESSANTILESVLQQRPSIAVLAGAGISVSLPTGLPKAKEFMEETINILVDSEDSRQYFIDQLACNRNDQKGLRFESFIEVLQNTCDPGLDILNLFIQPVTPNRNHLLLANLIKIGHTIFTTNFDTMIEQACLTLNITCKPIFDEQGFGEFMHSEIRYPLIKLHGTVSGRGASGKHSIRATLREIARDGYQLERNPVKQKILSRILAERDLIIMGYSGGDDYDIVPLLQTIASKRFLIWIAHKPGKDRASNLNEIIEKRIDHPTATVVKNIGKKRKPERVLYLECDTLAAVRKLSQLYSFDFSQLWNDSDQDQMFSIDAEFEDDLNKGIISGKLMDIFKTKGFPLSENAMITKEKDDKWVITDGEKIYIVKKEDDKLNIYKVSFPWTAFFKEWEKCHLTDSNIRKLVQAEMLWQSGARERALKIFQSLADSSEAKIRFFARERVNSRYMDEGKYTKMYGTRTNNSEQKEVLGIDIDSIIDTVKGGDILARTGYDKMAEKCYIDALNKVEEPVLKTEVKGKLANLYIRKREWGKAVPILDECVKVYRELHLVEEEANAMWALGNVMFHICQFQKALSLYEESYRILKWLNEEESASKLLNQIAAAYQKLGKPDLAIKKYEESIKIKESLNDFYGLGVTFLNLGILKQENGELDPALELCNKSLKIAEKVGDRTGVAIAYAQLGWILFLRKEYDQALFHSEQAKQIASKLEDESILNKIEIQIQKISNRR